MTTDTCADCGRTIGEKFVPDPNSSLNLHAFTVSAEDARVLAAEFGTTYELVLYASSRGFQQDIRELLATWPINKTSEDYAALAVHGFPPHYPHACRTAEQVAGEVAFVEAAERKGAEMMRAMSEGQIAADEDL